MVRHGGTGMLTAADLDRERLGVIKDGRVLPLSEAERRIINERRAVRA